MFKTFCTFFFFLEYFCPIEKTLPQDRFNFQEFFVAFELKKIQKNDVFDIDNLSFQQIRWMDYFILKYDLWNYSILKDIIQTYHIKKLNYHSNIKEWEKILLQIQNHYPYTEWKKEFFDYLDQNEKKFLNYLHKNSKDFYDLIKSQLNEEFLKVISTYDNKNIPNDFNLFNIPNFLIKEANQKIVYLSTFEAINFKNYKTHYIKYWTRFLFIQNFKSINYNHLI